MEQLAEESGQDQVSNKRGQCVTFPALLACYRVGFLLVAILAVVAVILVIILWHDTSSLSERLDYVNDQLKVIFHSSFSSIANNSGKRFSLKHRFLIKTGITGAPGIQGPPGQQGERGPTGAQGAPGERGER